jgi:hypothetical protein
MPGTNYQVKGFGTRRGQEALVYLIPNRKKLGNCYEKGISEPEWEQAYGQLCQSGVLDRRWFDAKMPECSKDGTCQFLAVGAVFVALGVAIKTRGKITLRANPTGPTH